MNEEEGKTLLKAPPRLLLGVAFLFWGAMHDRPVVALLAAVLMEGRNWTTLRWDFGLRGFARAWQISMVVLLVAAVGLLRVDDLSTVEFLGMLAWLPFIMMPLGLAQQYAREGGVPSVTFSFIARRKMAADRRAGRPVEVTRVHLGYPFLVLVLISAGMGVGSLGRAGATEFLYAGGIVLLLGWAFFQVGDRKERPLAWVTAYGLAMAAAAGMLWGLVFAYDYFLKGMSSSGGQSVSAFETQTSIGQIRELQLSPKILWRYYHEKGAVPGLLKLAAYDEPRGNFWQAGLRGLGVTEEIPEERDVGGDFQRLLRESEENFSFEENGRASGDYGRVGRLLGLVSEESLIPHARKTSRFEGVPAELLAVNSLGAFQMSGLKRAAMEVTIYADDGEVDLQLDPTARDLVYRKIEDDGLQKFLEEVGLEVPEDGVVNRRAYQHRVGAGGRPPWVSREHFREVEGRIGRAFREKFEYSLLLPGGDLRKPITEFLHETRKGHCEYFAGATANLLRRMGIPCRYVIGFAVQEKGGEAEWILRGQHAHAWVDAYVGGKWVDEGKEGEPLWRCRGGEWVTVDLTPPDWGTRGVERPWSQIFSDLFQQARARLVLWTSGGGLSKGVDVFLMVVVATGALFLGYRLFRARRRAGRAFGGSWDESAVANGVLRDFEHWLEKRVGTRPAGRPMGSWLREQLGEGGERLAGVYDRVTFGDGDGREKIETEVRKVKEWWKERQKNPEGRRPAG